MIAMKMEIKNRIRKARLFLKNNIRYVVVFAIFLFAIWYGSFVAKTDQKKVVNVKEEKHDDGGKLVEQLDFLQQESGFAKFVLNNENPKKEYQGMLNSRNGDFYRLIFKARSGVGEEASREESVESEKGNFRIKLSSRFGQEKEIGSFNSIDVENEFKEIVFGTDENFQNVVVEGKDFGEDLIFEYFSLYRLNVFSDLQAKNLQRTIFGQSESSEFLASRYPFNKQRNDKLSKTNQKITQYFTVPEDRVMTQLEMKIDKVGTGGSGEYLIRLVLIEQTTGKNETQNKINFSSEGLDAVRTNDNSYLFGLVANLKKGVTYSINIENDKAATDRDHYLVLENLSGEADWASYFKIISQKRTSIVESEEALLPGSIIQDLGDQRIFSYEATPSAVEILNIFSQEGELGFDEENGMISNRIKEGNFITYKFSTGYSFKSFAVNASAFNAGNENVVLEYSLDNRNWEEIVGEHQKGDPEELFGVTKSVGSQKDNVLYLRLFCREDAQQKSNFGFKKLSVSAVLKE